MQWIALKSIFFVLSVKGIFFVVAFAESALLKMSRLSWCGVGAGAMLFSLISEDTRANTERVHAFSFLITFLWFNRP